ncbi:MAG: helix-turn-helix transcriptional regulator [Bacteroidales bacterium]|nr:helix-turn-helix transcriptional regulator [Bacteroidales bacterium]
MRISYNKLWKLLIDKNMTKMELKDAAGISAASIAKLGKGANITTDVLLKICTTLNCKIEDILETIPDSE